MAITTNKGQDLLNLGSEKLEQKNIYHNLIWYTKSEWELFRLENNIPESELVANCDEH